MSFPAFRPGPYTTIVTVYPGPTVSCYGAGRATCIGRRAYSRTGLRAASVLRMTPVPVGAGISDDDAESSRGIAIHAKTCRGRRSHGSGMRYPATML